MKDKKCRGFFPVSQTISIPEFCPPPEDGWPHPADIVPAFVNPWISFAGAFLTGSRHACHNIDVVSGKE
ncbi:MAG: hypothetical protein KKC69_05520 [Acidobacteria bacterium]|nr:hypothetical protein [Acidobacteriota bacterium]